MAAIAIVSIIIGLVFASITGGIMANNFVKWVGEK